MDNILTPRRSCSWTYKINKLLVSPNERLNNIILDRAIKYNAYPASKFLRQKRPTLPLRLRAHGKKDQSSRGLLTCLHVHHMSYHMSQLPLYWPWYAPAKIKRGGHFRVLTGMWVFQNIILHRATNSAKSQAKLSLRSTSSNASKIKIPEQRLLRAAAQKEWAITAYYYIRYRRLAFRAQRKLGHDCLLPTFSRHLLGSKQERLRWWEAKKNEVLAKTLKIWHVRFYQSYMVRVSFNIRRWRVFACV